MAPLSKHSTRSPTDRNHADGASAGQRGRTNAQKLPDQAVEAAGKVVPSSSVFLSFACLVKVAPTTTPSPSPPETVSQCHLSGRRGSRFCKEMKSLDSRLPARMNIVWSFALDTVSREGGENKRGGPPSRCSTQGLEKEPTRAYRSST